MKNIAPLFIAALGLGACYDAQLDPLGDDVFACEASAECAAGMVCAAGVCRDESVLEGAVIRILEPSALAVFPAGEVSTIPLSIAGDHLNLTGADSDDPAAGYIEILLDGAVVDSITEGDLTAGVAINSLIAPADPGLHHIALLARGLDGEPLAGEQAHAWTAFWIDDGREHVGILTPVPGAKVELESSALSIEIASLNFTFVNPGFISPDEVNTPGAGYVHLFVDAAVPTCIPECNFEHQSVLAPSGLSRVNRMVSERAVVLPGDLGTTRIQIVAQDLLQQPYFRSGDTDELVFHQIPVQSVVELD